MTTRLWPALDVSDWLEVQPESRGQRSKWWVREPDSGEWLRKTPRSSRQSEPAVEVLVLELARAAGLWAAEARPCTWQTADGAQRGIVVRLFVDRTCEELSLGSEVLRMHVPGYDAGKWSQTPTRAKDTLQQLGSRAGVDLLTPFLAMLAFDAWVGNGDRHQENWGVLRAAGDAAGVRLAPMFDPAGCLGTELQNNSAFLREQSTERIRTYINRCPSGFGDGSGHALALADVVKQVSEWPEWRAQIGKWLAAFEAAINTGERLIAEIPSDWLSETRKQFAAKILEARLNWLREIP